MILRCRLSVAPGHPRTGPLGRLARLGLVAIFAGSLYSIVDERGSAHFRNPHILTEPAAWVLHMTMLLLFVVLVGTLAAPLVGPPLVRRTQIAALAVLLGGVVVAGSIGQLTSGSAWGFPLADLVWWFDVAMLATGFASTALAVALGTPGCEIGALRELTASTPDASSCVLGLHALDAWERRRTDRSQAAASR